MSGDGGMCDKRVITLAQLRLCCLRSELYCFVLADKHFLTDFAHTLYQCMLKQGNRNLPLVWE